MRILHTADWHLGKRLHKHDLSEDHTRFFHWMLETIRQQEVDVLLVSGDIFDQSNPSSEVRSQYYRVLSQLSQTGCQVVITGGNHDSPSMLNAPQEILRSLRIHVLGNMPVNQEEVLLPLFNRSGDQEAVVAAIPYLRDSEIRQLVKGESYEDRLQAISSGIRKVFDDAGICCQGKYQRYPAIAMGHLFAQGAQISESEREIQIGNLAGFEASLFHPHFSYYALGHIHKPQQVGGDRHIYYSGSPISLSFSEKDHEKRVMLMNLNGSLDVTSIPIPHQRKLLKISGDYHAVEQLLNKLEVEANGLHALLEVEMVEEKHDPAKVVQLESLLDTFDHPGAVVVKYKVKFKNKLTGSGQIFSTDKVLEDILPMEVFEKRLEKEGLSEQSREMLLDAFREVLEEVNREEV